MPDHHGAILMANGTRGFWDSYGSGIMTIRVGGRTYLFQWSEQFGPLPCTKDGQGRDVGPKDPFWRAASLWHLQGSRLNGTEAIWHEPKKPVLKHMGGRHFLIIEPGEPGHDW